MIKYDIKKLVKKYLYRIYSIVDSIKSNKEWEKACTILVLFIFYHILYHAFALHIVLLISSKKIKVLEPFTLPPNLRLIRTI